MKPYPTIRSFLLTAFLAISLPASHSGAVSISLVPDGPTTIEIGETVNVDVFMVLDAADQQVGISAATLHLELGSGFVDVGASSNGSLFPTAVANVVRTHDMIVFSQFGATVASPTALLGSLSITGKAQGSYDLVGRRFASFPLFTAPGDTVNRYDFASNEALLITVSCGTGACPVGSTGPIEWPPAPPPVVPDLPPDEPPPVITEPPPEEPPPEIATAPKGGHILLDWKTTTTTINNTDTGTIANTSLNTLTETLAFGGAGGAPAVPEPSTFALLAVALTALMLIRRRRVSG